MHFDWPNQGLGAVVGFTVGFFAHWAFVGFKESLARRELKKKYGNLAGSYANYGVNQQGTETATGGTIVLTWKGAGSFDVKGLHANGTVDWESVVHLNPEVEGTWTGSYQLTGQTGHGIQQITYVPNTRSFSVVTTVTSRIGWDPFMHHWKPKEK